MPARALILLALALTLLAGAGAPASAQNGLQHPNGPHNFLGRRHPGKIASLSDDGMMVDLKDGGNQTVQFSQIWRIRRSFVSDEPPGTTVIDFADNRLFVATPLATVIADADKRIPLVQFTAPNGEIIYMAANQVTDISNSIPGLHNPLSKTVIGTRDGTQQIVEPLDAVRRMVAGAHTAP